MTEFVCRTVRIARLGPLLQAVALLWASMSAAAELPVDLGTAGNFAVLTKSGITETGGHTSIISGDIGSSPITAAAMDGVWCSQMTGNIYGVDAAYTGSGVTTCFKGTAPDKTYVDVAVGDMETAYTDAAGRSTAPTVDLGAGNISGMTLAPGLYKWNTDLMMDATGVTLNGSATAVWIFQIAGNLTLASTATVNLAGGALAKNIFWQVGGVTGATLGTTSTLNGNILAAKQIIMNTGSTLNGRALSQTQVTLDGNPVTRPAAVPVLKGILAATTATATGQAIQLMLTVTNSGLANATNVTASIWHAGGPGFDGPTPSSVATLTPGSMATFVWTTTLTGAYTFVYSSTATEASGVSSPMATKTVTLPQAVVSGRLTATTPQVAGGPFLLTLTVSNTGLGLARVALTTTAFRVSGVGSTSTVYAGWNPTATAYVGYGSPVTFTWTVSAGTMGAGFTLSNTLYVTDANGGPALSPVVVSTSLAGSSAPTSTTVPPTGVNDSFIYPSPVHGTARITYVMAEAGTVKIRVYNAAGQLVDVVEENKPAGAQQTAVTTEHMAPGVYFYLLERRYGSGTTQKIGPRKFVVTR